MFMDMHLRRDKAVSPLARHELGDRSWDIVPSGRAWPPSLLFVVTSCEAVGSRTRGVSVNTTRYLPPRILSPAGMDREATAMPRRVIVADRAIRRSEAGQSRPDGGCVDQLHNVDIGTASRRSPNRYTRGPV